MVTEEEQSDMELASETIPVPQVPIQEEIPQEEISNQLDDIPPAKKPRTRKKTLHAAIRKQMEFYFSDANLSRDRFLTNLVKQDPYVDLEVFLKFNRIRELTLDTNRIAKALQDSTMLEVTEDGTKVHRITPISVKTNSEECTIYVQRLPLDVDHELLSSVFSQYGPIAYISIPKSKLTHSNKGFGFVEFNYSKDAEACLKAFRAKGCELPSQTSPNHVLSITTYNENEKEENTKNETNIKESNDSKESGNEADSKENLTVKAKRKLESVNSTIEEGNPKKSKKRKDEIVIEETTSKKEEESKNEEVQKTDIENGSREEPLSPKKNKRKKKVTNEIVLEKVTLDEKPEESSEEKKEEGSAVTKEKKKKNRHKNYMSAEKIDATDMGLQIMAKKEWKKLRNKYLDLQRLKMRQLKQHLFKARTNRKININKIEKMEECEDINNIQKQTGGIRDFPFTLGLIIKIELNEPCIDIQTFKKEFKSNSSVKYVDISEGSVTAYVRFDTPETAKEMVQKSTVDRQMSVIKDDEEKWYWEKMKIDRDDKLSKKVKVNQRGRNKLLKKAEKELGKHIKFDKV